MDIISCLHKCQSTTSLLTKTSLVLSWNFGLKIHSLFAPLGRTSSQEKGESKQTMRGVLVQNSKIKTKEVLVKNEVVNLTLVKARNNVQN